jgi:23S rRNA pseudouridine2605 synthase
MLHSSSLRTPYTHPVPLKDKNRPHDQRGAKHSPKNSPRTGLARALSKLGFCSRSSAAELIRSGRVRLNGTIRRDPETPVHVGRDRIEVDGQPIRRAEKIYLMLNKPRGVVTTTSDEQGRETVYDFLPDSARSRNQWLAPVGRLDKASEGLLLITNDSAWAARITDPASHLNKTYHVQIGAPATPELLDALALGLDSEGERLRVKRVSVIRQGEKNSWLEIVLDQGKNRQIRRMFSTLEIEVLRLIRIAIGPLNLGNLPKGGTRALTPAEKQSINAALSVVGTTSVIGTTG